MVVGCGLMCSDAFVGLSSWVWDCGSRFMGLSSWVCVRGSSAWPGLRSGWWVLVGVENKVDGWWLRWVAVAEAWVLGLMGFACRGSWVCEFCLPLYPPLPSLPLTLRLLPLKFFFLAMGLIFGWMLIVVVVGWPWVWDCCWMLMVYGGGGGWQWLAVEKKVVERERKW